jgi:hypothetical protein
MFKVDDYAAGLANILALARSSRHEADAASRASRGFQRLLELRDGNRAL